MNQDIAFASNYWEKGLFSVGIGCLTIFAIDTDERRLEMAPYSAQGIGLCIKWVQHVAFIF